MKPPFSPGDIITPVGTMTRIFSNASPGSTFLVVAILPHPYPSQPATQWWVATTVPQLQPTNPTQSDVAYIIPSHWKLVT